MTQDEFQKFARLMREAAETVGRTAPGDGALALSFEALRKYSFEQVRRGVAAHLASPEGRFMPTPSHIVERIEGKPQDRAALAWALVERVLLTNAGTRQNVRFPKPEFHWAIEHLGGWLVVGDKFYDGTNRDVQYLAQEFKRFYLMAEDAELDWVNVPVYLRGEWEVDNASNPLAHKVLIAGEWKYDPSKDLLDAAEQGRSAGHIAPAAMLAESKSCRF